MKIFKALRLINAPITQGRSLEFANMTNSFALLQEQSRFQALRTHYSTDIRTLTLPNSSIISAWYAINHEVKQAYIEGYMPIVMNGDHSQAVGSVSAAKQTYLDAQVLWIDAHSDIHTLDSSESHNIHGMPLSFLSKQLFNNTQNVEFFKCLDISRDLAYMGVRSVDRAESLVLDQYHIPQIQSLTMQPDRSLWISLDVDALDPSEFASTQTKEPNGITKQHVLNTLNQSLDQLIGCDITEVDINASEGAQQIDDLNFICDILELLARHVQKNNAPQETRSEQQQYDDCDSA